MYARNFAIFEVFIPVASHRPGVAGHLRNPPFETSKALRNQVSLLTSMLLSGGAAAFRVPSFEDSMFSAVDALIVQLWELPLFG